MGPRRVGGYRIAMGWFCTLSFGIGALIMLVPTPRYPNPDFGAFSTCCVISLAAMIVINSGVSAKKRANAQFMQSQFVSYPSIEQQRMMAQQNMMVQQQMAAQQKMNAEIQRKEQQRIAAQQEADRLKARMEKHTNHTAAQMQSMLETLNQLKESAEQSEREKQELEQKLETTKATTVVQNITYNIQDSAIAGDIHPGLNKQDES